MQQLHVRICAGGDGSTVVPTATKITSMVIFSPMVFIHPKPCSTSFRFRRLIAYPACRVVRASMALRRPMVCCAMCGVTLISRRLATKSRVS
jgi:hypothetical protein